MRPALLLVLLAGCYDLDARGVPPLATAPFVDPEAIGHVSLFRSSAGHDYSDSVESCRSMKHYLQPLGLPFGDALTTPLPVTSPIDGQVTEIRDESNGQDQQLWIRSSDEPAFTVVLFHVRPRDGLAVGDALAAGDPIGGITRGTDVAVRVGSGLGERLVSFFDAMPDDAFDAWRARGVDSRADLILSREARDADPLVCDGERFVATGTLPAWFILEEAEASPSR